MIGGIDQQVQSQMDAFRGNPQGLMQKYQEGQGLIELLALQKLKTEKESVARDIQAKLQQNPQTILEQREQEVLGLTKNELAGQVGATNNQQHGEQQQRAAQMGIAATPQAQQGVPGMAAGGIVSFQGGGQSPAARLGITEEEFAQLPEEQQRSLLASLEEPRNNGNPYINRVLYGEENPDRTWESDVVATLGLPVTGVKGIVDEAVVPAAREVGKFFKEGVQREFGIGYPSTPQIGSKLDALQAEDPEVVPNPGVGPAPEGIAALPTPGAKTSEMGGVKALMSESGMMDPEYRDRIKGLTETQAGRNADAEAEAARKRAQELTGMSDEEKEAYRRDMERREALYAQQNDPEKLRRQQLIRALTGGAGRRGFGNVMAGVATGSQNEQMRQEGEADAGLTAIAALRDTQRGRKFEAGQAELGADEASRANTERAIFGALTTAGAISNADVQAATQMANMVLSSRQQGQEFPGKILEASKHLLEIRKEINEKYGAQLTALMAKADKKSMKQLAALQEQIEADYSMPMYTAMSVLQAYGLTQQDAMGGAPAGRVVNVRPAQ